MNLLRSVLTFALLVHGALAGAQTVWVDDQLQIGLHTEASLTSPIAQLLSTGTQLELVEQNGEMAKVRTANGEQGWVDARWLSDEQPGIARVQAMERELAGAQAAVADLQAKLVAMEQTPQQVAQQRSEDEAGQLPSEALREMQLLAEENQRLKQQVAEFTAVERMAKERADSPAQLDLTSRFMDAIPSLDGAGEIINMERLKPWHLVLVVSILLLAFSLGGWLVDWAMRRRHGGFRV